MMNLTRSANMLGARRAAPSTSMALAFLGLFLMGSAFALPPGTSQPAFDLIEVGANDFRISDMGIDGQGNTARKAAVAYNPTRQEYLVVWEGNDVGAEIEIYGQLLDAQGNEIGPNDFRISDMGRNGDISYRPFSPAVVSLTLTNTGTTPQSLDFWSAFSGPASREPALGPKTLTLAPGGSITRNLTQRIPGGAPPGIYTYTANVGDFPVTVADSDSFQFEKAAGPSVANEE